MLDAELFRLTRRVQRVRKQEESGDQLWFGGAEYRRLAATVGVAAEKDPARSRSALPGNGGPVRRSWRKGKSQRRTTYPCAAKVSLSATSRGTEQFEPAPCVRIRASPLGFSGECRKPRTAGTSESSENEIAGCITSKPSGFCTVASESPSRSFASLRMTTISYSVMTHQQLFLLASR